MKKLLEVGRLLQELAIMHGIPVQRSLNILGFTPVNPPTIGSVSPLTNQPGNTNVQKRERKSRGSTKRRSTKASNQNTSNSETLNKDTSSGKRKASLSPHRPSKKVKVSKDLTDPLGRIIKLVSYDEKKRFELPFSPVHNGERYPDGKIKEKPKGGPLGLLQGIISDSYKKSDKAIARFGRLFSSSESFLGTIRCLAAFIASIDASAATFAIRALTVQQVVQALRTPVEFGLKILEEKFHWDTAHESLQVDRLMKIKSGLFERSGFHRMHDEYLADVKRTKEAQKRKGKVVVNNDDDFMKDND